MTCKKSHRSVYLWCGNLRYQNGASAPQDYYFVCNWRGDVTYIYDSNGNKLAKYSYDAWGNTAAITDPSGNQITDSNHIANINPIRYRGYYFDSETGMYYLQSRYYDPQVNRFINADGIIGANEDILGNNMFTYCGNAPVIRSDPSGLLWNNVINCLKKTWNKVRNWVGNTFGVGSTIVSQYKQESEIVPPGLNFLFTVKKGTKESKVLSTQGNSSKPISGYGQVRINNLLCSSFGMKFNTSNVTLNISFGLDNLGISGSYKKGKTTKSLGLSADLTQFKLGVEWSTSVECKWDPNTNIATYTNVGVTGWGVLTAYMLATTGQYSSSPQPAYS